MFYLLCHCHTHNILVSQKVINFVGPENGLITIKIINSMF